MKKLFQGTLLLSTLLLGSQVYANEVEVEAPVEKNWSVGIGSYAFTLAGDNSSSSDLDFSGFNLVAGYAFNNHFQIRATYFSLDNDTFALESSGFDVMAYGGVGLSKRGFRGYGGAGFFSDKWSEAGGSESFTGIQAGGGVGYNWGPVALDFVLTLRQADKYDGFVPKSGSYVAMSGNLSVSYLF
ncbi:hypothetical protein [Colwellia piezophila]|uniref:hypothetical protein n=1 Tax=Colwellia piezophila TaxID=211668 RepID=UPI000380440D|nr:hypothetical protein [Colwellia piezophila]